MNNATQGRRAMARAVLQPLEQRQQFSFTFGTPLQITPDGAASEQFDVAADAVGDFAIAWTSDGSGGPSGVFAQRFDRAGHASYPAVQLTETPHASNPSIALSDHGHVIVTWDVGQWPEDDVVMARRVGAGGSTAGPAFAVFSDSASGFHPHADVAADAAGDFVIVYGDRLRPAPASTYSRLASTAPASRSARPWTLVTSNRPTTTPPPRSR